MTTDDRDYYVKRAADEDEAARTAFSLAARWRHEELASLYRMRLLKMDSAVIGDGASVVVEPFILVTPTTHTEAA